MLTREQWMRAHTIAQVQRGTIWNGTVTDEHVELLRAAHRELLGMLTDEQREDLGRCDDIGLHGKRCVRDAGHEGRHRAHTLDMARWWHSPESFEDWHARQFIAGRIPHHHCTYESIRWATGPYEFSGRTCREVYGGEGLSPW